MATQGLTVRLRTDASPEQLLKELFLSPLIYLRLVAILFAIVVFGCVSDQLVRSDVLGTICVYNNSSACNFAIAIGVIAFLICLAFLVKDFVMVITDFSQAMNAKTIITVVDIAVSGLWTFMWFVAFCYTADQRRKRGTINDTTIRNCANSGVAFSFFSIIAWGAIIGVNIFFLIRMFKGLDRDSGAEGGTGGGYASFPEGQDSGEGDNQGPGYSPPEY